MGCIASKSPKWHWSNREVDRARVPQSHNATSRATSHSTGQQDESFKTLRTRCKNCSARHSLGPSKYISSVDHNGPLPNLKPNPRHEYTQPFTLTVTGAQCDAGTVLAQANIPYYADRMLLILDLDNTLIHNDFRLNTPCPKCGGRVKSVCSSPSRSGNWLVPIQEDIGDSCNCLLEPLEYFFCGGFVIAVRPYTRYLLANLSQHMDIIVWTHAVESYATKVCTHLGMSYFRAIISRSDTHPREWRKDVCRATSFLQHVVIVDDDRQNLELHPENAIVVQQFRGVESVGMPSVVRELYYLTHYLLQCSRMLEEPSVFTAPDSTTSCGKLVRATTYENNKMADERWIRCQNDSHDTRMVTITNTNAKATNSCACNLEMANISSLESDDGSTVILPVPTSFPCRVTVEPFDIIVCNQEEWYQVLALRDVRYFVPQWPYFFSNMVTAYYENNNREWDSCDRWTFEFNRIWHAALLSSQRIHFSA